MKKLLRSVSLFLAALMIGTALFSCADNTEEKPEVSSSAETQVIPPEEELDSLEARALIKDNLPDYNAEGGVYRILASPDATKDLEIFEEATGDVVEDAVYNRNLKIKERFNVNLETVFGKSYDSAAKDLREAVMADDDSYDIYAGHAIVSGGLATNDVLRNWYDLEYVNFSMPWWNKNSAEALTFDGVMLLMPGYMTLQFVGNTFVTYYNKKIAADYNLDNIYDIVNSGSWTIAKMKETTVGVYSDLNGNGKVDEEDQLGFANTAQSPAVTFMWSFDIPVVSFDDEYNAVIELNNQRTFDAYAALYDFYYETDGVLINDSSPMWGIQTFVRGNTLINPFLLNAAESKLRDFEADYAIIPYPKYDEDQNYYTMIDGGAPILGIPKTIRDDDKVGIITEALNAESWKTVVPAYYDIALKVKGTRDEESVAMMDLIMDSVKEDFCFIYDNWKGVAFMFQDLLMNKNPNISSYVEKKTKGALRHYDKVIAAFTGYGE